MTTFYTARDYTDQFANLNFIINMKSLKEKEKEKKEKSSSSSSQSSSRTTEPVAGPSSAPV